jgi:ABC-2 type transport system permease protein
VNTIRRVGVIVAHELRILRRDPLPLMVLIVFPLLTMAFLKPAFRPVLVEHGDASANGAEQVVPGQATMSAFFLVPLVTFGFYGEHAWATWERLRASSASSFEITAGKTLPRLGMGVAQFVVVLIGGVVLFDLHIQGDVYALAPLVLTFSLALVMLGVAVTALCRTAQQANSFGYLGLVLFGALGGAMVPFAVLPGWAQAVAPATPTYWAMRGFRSVIVDGEGMSGVLLPSLVLGAMAAGFLVVALRRFRFADTKVGFG